MSKNNNNNNLFFGPMEFENPKVIALPPSKNIKKNRSLRNKNRNRNKTKNNKANKTTLKNKPKGPPFKLLTPNEIKELSKSMKNYNYM
jgi:hypothetical protein